MGVLRGREGCTGASTRGACPVLPHPTPTPSAAFWTKGPEQLTEWRRVEDRIAKAHANLARRREIETLIADFVGTEADPARTMAIPYGAAKAAQLKGFTEDEDRFLLCMLNALGE